MQPHEHGPRRRNMRHLPNREQQRYVPTEELIRRAEEMLAETAQMAREAELELFQVSFCTNSLCDFVGKGDWIHCPNGHPVVCGEVTEPTRNSLTSGWN